MSIPRKNPFCLEAALWYHCTLHCVRRVFLCSRDKLSGKNFEHRRRWMEDRIHELACVFALDLLRGLSSSPPKRRCFQASSSSFSPITWTFRGV